MKLRFVIKREMSDCQLSTFPLRHDNGSSRVVGNEGRPAYLELRFGLDVIVGRDEDLALVETGVRLLDVFNLQQIRGTRLERRRKSYFRITEWKWRITGS